MRRYKILYIDHFPEIGGGQRSLLTRLRTLDKDRFAPIVACGNPKGTFYEELTKLDVQTELVSMNKSKVTSRHEGNIYKQPLSLLSNITPVVRSVIKLVRIIQSESVDLIHSNSVKAAALGCMASKLTNTPSIFHVRSAREYSYHGWIDNFISSCATKIVANSRFTAKSFEPWKDKISVIYSPVDFGRFKPALADGNRIRDEFGLSEEANLVGLVGRITPRKRQTDLLRAAPDILKTYPNTRFLIVGGSYPGVDQDYEKKVKELTKDLGLENQVIFTGYRDDVPDIMSALDVLVLPSLQEPLGRVIIEALVFDTPVVATDSGGIPEIIEDGRSGLLVPPQSPEEISESVIRILEDENFARELVQQGKKDVQQKFSAEIITRREEELYRNLLDKRNN